MERWSFELLGGVSARSASHSLDDLMGKKPGAVLALLALSPGRPRLREEIIDLIWPEVALEDARNRFRLVLFGLRKILEPPGTPPGSVLFADRTKIGIVAEHSSDVVAFQQALRRAAVATEPELQAQHLRTALALYKGEFAPGFYLDVLLTERQRLAALADGAQHKLAQLESLRPVAPTPDVPLVPPFVTAKDRFFGRKNEQEHLKNLVERNRLVTILGPGGIGKTRLAQKLAQTVTLGEKSHFVSLANLQHGVSIPDILVVSLNLPPSAGTALARLKMAFALDETLLVLDNIEHLLDSGGSEAISSLLEALPNVRILATSRVRSNLPQECLYPLGSLPDEDAFDLFIDRAQRTKFDFACTAENAPAIRALCRRLDGLPLAIELATARIAVLPPAKILERLSKRFDLLTDKRKDRHERHRSLRAALDWGWGLLSSEVQRFFVQVSLFRGSFSLEAVEAITEEPLAIDYLQNLLEASFLYGFTSVEQGQEEQRFYLLETLREYGLEKLEEWSSTERAELIDRYGDYFLEKAISLRQRLSEEEVPKTVQSFKTDIDNYASAINILLDHNILMAVNICLKVNIFWIYSLTYRENIIYLEKTLDKFLKSPQIDHFLLIGLYDAIGVAYTYIYNYEKSYKYSKIAIEHARSYITQGLNDNIDKSEMIKRYKRLSGALHNLSLSLDHSPDEQEQLLLEAANLNRQIGNDSWLALNLSRLYYVYEYHALRNIDSERCPEFLQKALYYANEAYLLSKSLKNDYYLSHHLGNLSSALIGAEKLSDALNYLHESFSLALNSDLKDDFTKNLMHFHCIALKISRNESATQFLGAVDNFAQQWDININEERHTHFYGALQPLRDSLPQALGQERYDALYQEGFHATVDTIKQWVATIHLDDGQ